MSLTPGTKLGPYEIISPLGAGGMGEVYRAKDSRLGREVAIKVLLAGYAVDGERLKRFELEARATGALNHPNILSIFDSGTHEGAPYLVAELLEGETLRERLNRGAIPPRKAVEWAIQMAHGLAAAHEKGIVHRDLKPENLFIIKDSRLKILDFGLAKLVEPAAAQQDNNETPTRTVNTSAGAVMGTVGYMSPEQVRGEPVDLRSDLFAFGVILYEMISGKRAFKGNSAVETMNAILTIDPPEFPPIEPPMPPGLERLVRHCLEKTPAARFQSAHDLAFNLESLSGISGSASASVIATPVLPERQIIRSAFLPSDNTKIELDDVHAASLSISPDGSLLVFAVESPGKKKSLWIRPLNSLASHPLVGTDDAHYPFWSPDSRFIGFFSKGKMKKISATGGSAATLCDVPAGYGGTWSQDNQILFIPKLGGLIHQVSSSGGAVTPVTLPSGISPGVPRHWPVFMPDGKHYLYLMRGGDSSGKLAFGIYIASLDGMTNHFIAAGSSNAVFTGRHLLYQRGKVLIAQLFDPQTRESIAEPVAIAESVRLLSDQLLGTFTASRNGILVYQAGSADHGDDCQLVWLDNAGEQTGLLGKPTLCEWARISPDGKRVAATIREPDRLANDLWIYDVARGLRTRITSESSYKHWPTWSPDGKRIAYNAILPEAIEIREIMADGSGGAVRLLESNVNVFPCDWSPDGRLLMYFEVDRSDRTKLNLMGLARDADNKPFPILTEGSPKPMAKISPNGKWIAYESDLSGTGDVYVTPFPGPGGKTLIATEGGAGPFWRSDGKALLFEQNDQVMETEINCEGDTLEVGETRLLASLSKWVKGLRGYDISADGQKILLIVKQDLLASDSSQAATQPVILVVNWDAELKK